MKIQPLLILHCETEPFWDLMPWKIRIKGILGILSDEECKEWGIKKVKNEKTNR